MNKPYLSLVCGVIALAANSAMADGWPTTVVGNWSVMGNQTPGTLSITGQGAAGNCRAISGWIYDATTPIEGFYCPFSGHIHFLRKWAANNDTSQVWTGTLSQTATVLRIGGAFSVINTAGGSLGEYSFTATK